MTMFEDMFSRGAATVLKHVHGRSVTYLAYGESEGTVITAIYWRPRQERADYVPDGQQTLNVGDLAVSAADVTSPDHRDRFQIDDETWAVMSVDGDNAVVRMSLEKRDQTEVGGAGRRIQR